MVKTFAISPISKAVMTIPHSMIAAPSMCSPNDGVGLAAELAAQRAPRRTRTTGPTLEPDRREPAPGLALHLRPNGIVGIEAMYGEMIKFVELGVPLLETRILRAHRAHQANHARE